MPQYFKIKSGRVKIAKFTLNGTHDDRYLVHAMTFFGVVLYWEQEKYKAKKPAVAKEY
jgi:hypothetical protein